MYTWSPIFCDATVTAAVLTRGSGDGRAGAWPMWPGVRLSAGFSWRTADNTAILRTVTRFSLEECILASWASQRKRYNLDVGKMWKLTQDPSAWKLEQLKFAMEVTVKMLRSHKVQLSYFQPSWGLISFLSYGIILESGGIMECLRNRGDVSGILYRCPHIKKMRWVS